MDSTITMLKNSDNHDYIIHLNPLLKDGEDVESYGTVEFESGYSQYIMEWNS